MEPKEDVFLNGKIFQSTTQEGTPQATFHTSLLIQDGTIIHVGSPTDPAILAAQSRPGTTTHDLRGQTVLPGFIDGHMHLLLFGQSLQKLSLDHCTSLATIRGAISAYAAANPSVPRIFCKGWMHSMTPEGVSFADLDDLDPRPIFVDTKDLHSTWCSSSALAELAVAAAPDPPGGTIHRDAATSAATGLLSEAAVFTLVWPHIASVATVPERAASMHAGLLAYRAAGYTGLVDMAMDEAAWAALLALRAASAPPALPVRVAAYWLIKPSGSPADAAAQVDRAAALAAQHSAPDCRVVGVKVICDGIVDACTAALAEPYASGVPSPGPIWTAAQLAPVVARAAAAGLQVALHAIGDETVAMCIDVLEAAAAALQAAGKPPLRRPRIEHLELCSARDAARLGAAGITASVQPVHADPAVLRAWPRLLGGARCARAFAYAEFAAGGAGLALGSDAPTAPNGVLANVYVATTRRSAREPASEEVVNPEFALGLCQAVVAATEGAAHSCFAEGWSGSLEVGKKADFVVVDMVWEPERLLEAKVVETWFEGQKVFDAAA